MAPQLLENAVRMEDGAELPMRSWLPNPVSPRAVILALHGFNDYSNFFDATGVYLAKHGIASYAYDQRGFGRAPNRGYWPGNISLERDVKTAIRVLRGRHPGTPLYLLGVSMGGAVAMLTVAEPTPAMVDGVILAAPAVWGRGTMWWGQTALLWLAAHTAPGVTLTGRGLGIKASDNIEMLRALGRDPLVIKETRIDAIHGLVGLMDEASEAAGRIDFPTLTLYGERDELIPEDAMQKMLAHMSPDRGGTRHIITYDNGYHMLLRGLDADVVRSDIVAWIVDPTAPIPSWSGQGKAIRIGVGSHAGE
ncbi:MAG: lysophospholipase [Rhodospirillales bacterium]|nr:lysophospholipase [Rhodospirillales bacterium]